MSHRATDLHVWEAVLREAEGRDSAVTPRTVACSMRSCRPCVDSKELSSSSLPSSEEGKALRRQV